MDMAQAQAQFGRSGEIHQIDIQLAEAASLAGVRERLQVRLGPSVRVVTPEQRERQA